MWQEVGREVDAVRSKPWAAGDVGERSDTTLSKLRAVAREREKQECKNISKHGDTMCGSRLALSENISKAQHAHTDRFLAFISTHLQL